jgi:hypothetical protein
LLSIDLDLLNVLLYNPAYIRSGEEEKTRRWLVAGVGLNDWRPRTASVAAKAGTECYPAS